MRRFKIIVLAATIAMVFTSAACAADVRVSAVVDVSRDIYAGDQFTYRIIIDGYDQPGEVDLSPLAAYKPRSAGGGNNSQTSISIINGKSTTNVVRQYVMNYVLTAPQAGPMHIQPVTVTVGGTQYQTNEVMLNVTKPGTTELLELETTLSQEKCYVGQPVILTVKFYRYANIGDYQFNIPALDSDDFVVEEFEGDAGQAKQNRVNRGGREAILLSFRKVLIPKRTGDIDLGTPSVSADVAIGRSRSRDDFFGDFFGSSVQYKRFSVSSQPMKLIVSPLPNLNAPAGFYGLVGRYTITAQATPTKVSVGDPITLTIRIAGDYLKSVRWPAIERMPAFADNFKIPSEVASPVIENGVKVFTQTLRPTNDKITEIPAIPLVYFDADKGQYVTAKSEPIKLEVSPTKILTTADVEGHDFTPAGREVEVIKKGISANYEGRDCLVNVGFSITSAVVSPVYLAGWLLPLVVLVGSIITKTFVQMTPEQEAKKLKRKAAGRAIAGLKKAASVPEKNRYEVISVAMKQYIGERFDKVAGSLTADDCSRAIVEGTGDSETAARFRDIISDCEAARYAPVQLQLNSTTINEVIKLIRIIDKKSKI
jgi:hypothetical protein